MLGRTATLGCKSCELTGSITGIYGFYDECRRRHSVRIWKLFNEVFDCLPFSAIIEEKIMCVHAGLSPELQHLDQVGPAPLPAPPLRPALSTPHGYHSVADAVSVRTGQLRNIPRPTEIPDAGLLCDLLWSDPEEAVKGWGESVRGVSFTFGEDVVTKFLARTGLDLVVRAHQARFLFSHQCFQ